jgi:5-(carboxyamino)imidazole ribonucleotide mutase
MSTRVFDNVGQQSTDSIKHLLAIDEPGRHTYNTQHRPEEKVGITMQVLVGVIMGSRSDWETMSHAAHTLETLGVPFEVRVVSAHRTPDLLFEYAGGARDRGLEVIIAGAGGAAHLPGMAAAKTSLPVLGVPVESKALKGMDSLLSIAQMPAGIPVGTLAIGRAGAVNAALLACAILANKYPAYHDALQRYRAAQTQAVLDHPDPEESQ